jgi:hypothetical protein
VRRKQPADLRELRSNRGDLVTGNTMSFCEFPQRPLRQVAPFTLVGEVSAFPARCPRSYGKSACEDRLSFRHEIRTPVHLADRRCAAEIAVVSATRHDAGTGVIERFQI